MFTSIAAFSRIKIAKRDINLQDDGRIEIRRSQQMGTIMLDGNTNESYNV